MTIYTYNILIMLDLILLEAYPAIPFLILVPILCFSLFLIIHFYQSVKYKNLHFIGLLIFGVMSTALIPNGNTKSNIPNLTGRYEICGSRDVVAFNLNDDGTTNNGKGSQNGGIYGHWEQSSDGIVISGMGSEWDGNYLLDGTTDGVALKKGNIRYCNPSYR